MRRYKDIRKLVDAKGKISFNILTETRFFIIQTNMYFNQEEDGNWIILKEREKKELLKIQEWIDSETMKFLEASDTFNTDSLYMYIRVKAAKDQEFLEWWEAYGITIDNYYYNLDNDYSRNMKSLR